MVKQEILKLLDFPIEKLILESSSVKRQYAPNELDLCNILNARSGLCKENCKFCAQSMHHKTGIQTYPLKNKDEIIKSAINAKNIGAKRFGIVTSGNTLDDKEFEVILSAIKYLKENVNIILCASLGKLTKEQLQKLKSNGLSRYHHNIETSRNHYNKIVSTHSFDERIETIKNAKDSGLEVCSGGIIGMGENWEDRIDMFLTLKDLDVDSIPINILMPIKGTALENIDEISSLDVIRTIAIARIILKDKTIKIAAGRETKLKDFQALGFLAGANGMLIGGYLTINGRDIKEDYKLIEDIKGL
jgi:biotin synthase